MSKVIGATVPHCDKCGQERTLTLIPIESNLTLKRSLHVCEDCIQAGKEVALELLMLYKQQVSDTKNKLLRMTDGWFMNNKEKNK